MTTAGTRLLIALALLACASARAVLAVDAATFAEIVADIRANPKHRAVVDFRAVSDAELLAAAEWVRRRCAGL
jgi:hypothetical protein